MLLVCKRYFNYLILNYFKRIDGAVGFRILQKMLKFGFTDNDIRDPHKVYNKSTLNAI